MENPASYKCDKKKRTRGQAARGQAHAPYLVGKKITKKIYCRKLATIIHPGGTTGRAYLLSNPVRSMTSTSLSRLQYSNRDVKEFRNYFGEPKKKRGRPKKKKGKAKSGRKKKKGKQITIDLTTTENVRTTARRDAEMAGLVQMHSRTTLSRTNWDKPENAELRMRLAESWVEKKDLYRAGETFYRFCMRNGIDRNVLSRFIARQKQGIPPKKRGRKTILSEDVIKHLCEGGFFSVRVVLHACMQLVF